MRPDLVGRVNLMHPSCTPERRVSRRSLGGFDGLLRSVAMAPRTIPQRELRNNIGEVLREAERGTEFTITVRGRPVARLGPPHERQVRRVDVDVETVRALLEGTPVDDRLESDLEQIRAGEVPVDEPWRDR